MLFDATDAHLKLKALINFAFLKFGKFLVDPIDFQVKLVEALVERLQIILSGHPFLDEVHGLKKIAKIVFHRLPSYHTRSWPPHAESSYVVNQISRPIDGGLSTGRGSDLESVVVLFKLDPVVVEEPLLPE
jgi:hypothetical protein